MNSAIHARLPVDHLIAEMAAYPFASEASLELGLTSLDPSMSEPTRSLWTRCERELARAFPSTPLDELVAVRDETWFPGARAAPLHVALEGMAREVLRDHGHMTTPWARQDPAHMRPAPEPALPPELLARRRLRWLRFAMPRDMLVTAASRSSTPTSCEMISPTLARRLKMGFAEVHVHQGAALDFPLLWLSALQSIRPTARDRLGDDAFASAGADLEEGRLFLPLLLRAAVAREVLGLFFRWQSLGLSTNGPVQPQTLRDFLNRALLPRLASLGAASTVNQLMTALTELRRGTQGADGWMKSAIVRQLLRDLATLRPRGPRRPEDLVAFVSRDAIAQLSGATEASHVEAWLMSRSLSYLRSPPQPNKDPGFEGLFWQLMRVRNLFYRHIVQRPMTPGLPWFVRFYGRLSAGRKALPRDARHERAVALYGGKAQGLKALELRSGPSANLTRMRKETEAIGALARRHDVEAGLIFHFSRDRGGGMAKGHPKARGSQSEADPDLKGQGFRFARFYRRKAREAGALARLVLRRPELLYTVCGLDLCTDEAGIPLWVMAPLVRYVKAQAHRSAEVYYRLTGEKLPPLRTTVHVGEDIVHLASALRRVDEATELLNMGNGDRLGHAIALGLDATAWATSRGQLHVNRETRMWDLTWEWAYGLRHSVPISGDRAALIERECRRLSSLIFGEALSPQELEQLRSRLGTSAALLATGWPSDRAPRGAVSRLHRYLRDPGVFARGQVLETVHPAAEAPSLELLQRSQRAIMAQRGMAVEINPSSNLLIGDLSDLTRHPLWRLRPPAPLAEGQQAPPVTVLIGSDDPITFATNLREEYQLLHDALIAGGLGADDASRWLEDARQAGLVFSFAHPPRPPASPPGLWAAAMPGYHPPPGI